MPDRRQHRGPQQQDAKLFANAALPALRGAVADLSWLLSRGYKDVSSLKLVGDRFKLNVRQRQAVQRSACAEEALAGRHSRALACAARALAGRDVLVDGFNVLITLEAALSGGLVIVGRDGAHRDLSSVHGSYRKVVETSVAAGLALDALAAAAPRSARWLLDRPVSNSGRLAGTLREEMAARGLDWEVELVDAADRALASFAGVVATSDSWILDRCAAWTDVPAAALAGRACWRLALG